MAKKTPYDHIRSEDLNLSLLRRLLRAAERLTAGRFKRPAEEAIEAYISRAATPKQRQEVQKALAQSAKFRNELLALAEEHEGWTLDGGIK